MIYIGIITISTILIIIRLVTFPLIWWSEVRKFKTSGPIRDCIVFTGSSSIRFWETLAQDMAPLPVVNRGFGGSQMPHLFFYKDYIFSGCNPQAIVVYSGDNDFASRRFKTPGRVLRDFQRFVDWVQTRYPNKPIYVISIKLSPSRIRKWNKFIETNRLLQRFAQERRGVTFIDANPALARYQSEDIYIADQLHFSDKGYEVWTSVVKPILLNSGFNQGKSREV